MGDKEVANYFEVFGRNRKVLLPVVHVVDLDTAMENVRVAQGEGADGVFLINHSITSARLWPIYKTVKAQFPDFWVGVNCLDLSPVQTFQKAPEGLEGVWVDNARVSLDDKTQYDAFEILRERSSSDHYRNCLYFGGVAMKYQPEVANEDLVTLCSLAVTYVDVVTTSGPATGRPAAIEKIQLMKSGLESKPLAISSGVSLENVEQYLPLVDAYLVASSICVHDPSGVDLLVPERVRMLAAKIHSWRK